MSETLLADIKNHLDITWDDPNTNKKIQGIGERGIKYLNSAVRDELDYEEEDKPKELLLEYCRYVRSGALDMFQKNFLSEILSLQRDHAIKKYKESLDESADI